MVVAASGKDPTLRYAPSQVCFANIVEFSFSAPNFMHTLRMTQ